MQTLGSDDRHTAGSALASRFNPPSHVAKFSLPFRFSIIRCNRRRDSQLPVQGHRASCRWFPRPSLHRDRAGSAAKAGTTRRGGDVGLSARSAGQPTRSDSGRSRRFLQHPNQQPVEALLLFAHCLQLTAQQSVACCTQELSMRAGFVRMTRRVGKPTAIATTTALQRKHEKETVTTSTSLPPNTRSRGAPSQANTNPLASPARPASPPDAPRGPNSRRIRAPRPRGRRIRQGTAASRTPQRRRCPSRPTADSRPGEDRQHAVRLGNTSQVVVELACALRERNVTANATAETSSSSRVQKNPKLAASELVRRRKPAWATAALRIAPRTATSSASTMTGIQSSAASGARPSGSRDPRSHGQRVPSLVLVRQHRVERQLHFVADGFRGWIWWAVQPSSMNRNASSWYSSLVSRQAVLE